MLISIFRDYFYGIDFAIGASAPVLAYLLYRWGKASRFEWLMFWVGVGLGLLWEVPMSTLNEFGPDLAVHRFVRPLPVPFWAVIVSHSLWDGGLFFIGVRLLMLVGGGRAFERFRPLELAVLMAWGQGSELWVELTSTFGEAWVYIVRPWNPMLFTFNGLEITLMPQLIWLAATLVFYWLGLKLRPRVKDAPPGRGALTEKA